MKYLMICIVLVFSSCVSRSLEQTISIVNNSGLELKGIAIRSSWEHRHGIFKSPSSKAIFIDSLGNGNEIELSYFGIINKSCLSITSDSLNLIIMDCMENEKIRAKSFKIIIDRNSLNVQI